MLNPISYKEEMHVRIILNPKPIRCGGVPGNCIVYKSFCWGAGAYPGNLHVTCPSFELNNLNVSVYYYHT